VREEQIINALIQKSRVAQREYSVFRQKEVDAIVKAIGKTVFSRAEELARMAIEESGMGDYNDKIAKCIGKSSNIWNSLKGKKSVDIIGEDKEKGIILVAKPIGVIGMVIPCTNPVVTPMCNLMFALKGRNSAIIAPHPRGKKCARHIVDLFSTAIKRLGAPDNLIQVIDEPSLELTNELMKSVDLVVATGGMAMVKAAYSSGTPSYGVGAGNVQVIIDRDYDLAQAVADIARGGKFDNGIICSGEQSAIIPEEYYEAALKIFEANHVFVARGADNADRFRKVLFDKDGTFNRDAVGQSPQAIGKMAGVAVPEGYSVIMLEPAGFGRADLLCKEKLGPVMICLRYKTFEEAIAMAQANLEYEGAGHTAAIHSNNRAHIEQAGIKLTVSRLVVNQPSSISAGGAYYNGFAPTTTLGCGTWGNNILSENLDYTHLINISRIGMPIKGAHSPTNQEVWGD
jgi:succinate-semialdehyde dehydrogenase